MDRYGATSAIHCHMGHCFYGSICSTYQMGCPTDRCFYHMGNLVPHVQLVVLWIVVPQVQLVVIWVVASMGHFILHVHGLPCGSLLPWIILSHAQVKWLVLCVILSYRSSGLSYGPLFLWVIFQLVVLWVVEMLMNVLSTCTFVLKRGRPR